MIDVGPLTTSLVDLPWEILLDIFKSQILDVNDIFIIRLVRRAETGSGVVRNLF